MTEHYATSIKEQKEPARRGRGTNSNSNERFRAALAAIPTSYTTGHFRGSRWGTTKKVSLDGRRIWLFAEELGGSLIVSFNAYWLANGGPVLKPCEMSIERIADFVLGYAVDLAPPSATKPHAHP